MVGRCHKDIGVRRKGLVHRVHAQRRAHHDGQVSQVVSQLVQQLFTVAHTKVQRHARVAPCKLHQQAGKKIIAGTDHSDVQLAAGDALELRHGLLDFLELLDDDPARLKHLHPRRREVDLLAELLEQRKAGMILQLFDLDGHRRLRQVQLFGSPRKAQVPGHGLEHLELTQRRILHFELLNP